MEMISVDRWRFAAIFSWSLSLSLIWGEPGAGQEPTTPAIKTEGGNRPATCLVEKGPIQVDVVLKGVFEAEQMAEVALSPEAATVPLTVMNVVEPGTVVKTGDVLVGLDLEKIDRAIKDIQAERVLAELALKHAGEELPILERLQPLDLAAAERSKTRADEDLARFFAVVRPMVELDAEFLVKSAGYYVESARDELAQLEKMYRSKDLTEETEQQILKRYRFMVEMSLVQQKTMQAQSEQTLKVETPRREQSLRDEVARQTLALERSRSLSPLELNQKRLAQAKLAYDFAKEGEKLAELGRDREAMTVRSPLAGVVYYGKAERGQWTTAAAVAPKLRKGGVLTAQEVVLTVVTPRPLFVRATVEEKDLHALKTGQEGKVVPVGLPDSKMRARLESVSAIPLTPGNFEARVGVELPEGADVVMPGMACSVKLVAYRKVDALTVPASAVFGEESDEESAYVYVVDAGHSPEKRVVTRGKSARSRVEILEGLRAGDAILTAKP